MDLVKVGFIVQADGLKDAENQVDRILQKVDQLNKKKVNIPSGSSPSASGGAGKPASNNSSGLSTSERMLKTQQLLTTLLPTLDRQTANLVARFQLASNSVAELNQFLTLLGQNQAIVKQQRDAEKLAADQKRLADEVEAARQKKFSAEQNYYQKQMDLESKANAATIQAAEDARQKKFAAEQVYYQKQMELAKKEAEETAKVQKKKDDDAEKARQKRFSAEQKHYQQQIEQVNRIQQAEKNRLASQQKLIDTTLATTKYQQQGLSATNAGKVARMEVSGADAATVTRYKQALLDAQAAMNSFGKSAEEAGKKQGFFNTQVGGIVKYAVLSAVIYGIMTATLNLGAAIVKTADEYTSIQNRMKLYITDANELARVNEKLAQFSVDNNVGLRETSTLFSRLAPAMQKIGANTSAVTTVVDSFGKSMRIGGATAMEAASATLQFSQAMASGKLNGDEFRAISEASPRFLKAIADGSGIAAEKLKEMSSAGALTTEVISKALIKEYAKLSAENEKLGYTLEQGANALKTAFTVLIGEFNEGAGVTQFFGTMMVNLADGMLEASKGAKEFGTGVREWFTENKGIIEGLGKAVEILAYLFAGKLVASYVVSAVSAYKAAAANVALVASQTGVSKSSATTAVMMQRLGVAALQAGTAISTAGTMMKTAFAFLGGWVGLITTVVTATAAYFAFNQANAATAESFRKEGESIDQTITKYKELSKVKQQATLDSEVANLKELEKAYNANRTALFESINELGRSNNLTAQQRNEMNDVAMAYAKGKISLEALVDTVNKSSTASEESKVKVRGFAASVMEAAEKAGVSKDLIAQMRKELSSSGEKAAFAKTGVDAFTKGLEEQAKKLRETTALAKKYGLEIQTAAKLQAELANRFSARETSYATTRENLVTLRKKYTAKGDQASVAVLDKGLEANQKAQNALLKEKAAVTDKLVTSARKLESAEQEQSDYTAALRKAEKAEEKAVNTRQKNIEKYQNQAKELGVYITLLKEAQNLEVARIASEKEYQNAFGANLAMAKGLYDLQQEAAWAEANAEYKKGLDEAAEAQDRLAGFLRLGLSIEEARALVQAKYMANEKGKAVAAMQLTNEAYEQHFALASQISDQQAINTLLAQGYDLEAAIFRIRSAKVRGLSGNDTDLDTLDAEYDKQVKVAAANKAQAEALLEINSLNREARLLVAATADGYTRAALAAASLAGATNGLSLSIATSVLMKRDQVAYDKELAQNTVQMLSYLSDESEALRNIKDTYKTITPEAAKVMEIERKRLDIYKAYADKKEAEKDKPLGDFSKVNFEVFGDFGNPFQEALDGLNAFVAGNVKLNESLDIIRTKLEELKSQAFVEEMFGNEEGVKKLNAEIDKTSKVEQDYLKQKQAAQEDVFASGLKFSKSFFKEESKGYKAITLLEQAQQGIRIALAIEEAAVKIGLVETTTLAIIAANAKQQISDGITAAISSMKGLPFPYNIAAMGATVAAIAGLGVALAGGFNSSSGTITPSNDGTGTVFGDKEAQSESIKKSIDLLAENSDLMLPINNAMLRALKNIESALGGVANLIIRGDIGNTFASGLEFDGKLTGVIGKLQSVSSKVASAFNFLDKFSGFDMGGLFNGIRDTILGGLFGKTSQAVTGSGLFAGSQSLGSVLDNGLNLQQYADIATTKKSWFSKSTSYSTQFGKVDQEIKNQFGLIFDGVFNSILTASSALGKDGNEVTQALRNSIINIGKIDTKGLTGEEIQKKLEAVISAQADTVAKNAVKGLDAFQKIGEGYFETLTRVATGIEQAAYYTDQLGYTVINYTDIIAKQGDVASEIIRQSVLLNESTKAIKGGFYDMVNQFDGTAEELYSFIIELRDLQDQLFMTGKNANYLTTAMVLGAGGLDSLRSGLDAYFEMLSPAEQAAELTRRLTNEFAIFGKQLPANVQAYRDLVNSVDISTEAGQKLYGQIIALAPEFNDLQDSLDKANSEVNALVKSLRDLAEEARKARGETEQPRNLDYVRNQFQNDSILAMQGDTAAAERLLSLGKDLMSLSKQYSVSGSEYAKDLALIQRAATVSADVQEAGLGYEPSTTLSTALMSGANTSATINTNTSSTDAKLDALREDLNVALLAIAKYTQATATKLENWDGGDRMTVRIEQYGSNDKIPVSTA